ncbi:MAG: hypothetical protein GY720_20550 [bacterium]|nr:hypothetical protein [bacterium]
MGIYLEDKESLLSWIGSQAGYDDAVSAIDSRRLTFIEEPTHDNLGFAVDEVLLDRLDCVVVEATLNAKGVLEGASSPSTLILIYWPTEAGVFLDGAVWEQGTPQFQWIEECDIAERGVTP